MMRIAAAGISMHFRVKRSMSYSFFMIGFVPPS